MRIGVTISFLAFGLAAGHAAADPRCEPLESAETLPLAYLDRPDPIASRVAASIEDALLADQISGERPAPLVKLYCRIGMTQMAVRFVQPLRDDSLAAMVTEAIYDWRPEAEPPGWQLSALHRQPLCARGDKPFAPLCP